MYATVYIGKIPVARLAVESAYEYAAWLRQDELSQWKPVSVISEVTQ